jgi:LuxR family maltose regulon positive regulatory protein
MVRGPAGAGKTVAVRDWVIRAPSDVAWVTVDRETSSHTTFAHAIIRALRRTADLRADVMGDDSWSRLREFIRDRDEPLTLVVDDAATASDDALREVTSLLRASVNLRVVVITNRTTGLDGAGIRLLVDRSEVGPLDLMMTEDEIAAALDVAPALAEQLHAATSGFPAIVDAIAKGRQGSDTTLLVQEAIEASEHFMQLRVAEAGHDDALVEALIPASVAPHLDQSLAHALLGKSSESVLKQAEHAGLGVWLAESGSRRFHLAPFARALLRRELDRRDPDETARLRSVVVHSLLEGGNDIEALEVALAHGDLALAAEVVGKRWFRLMRDAGARARELLSEIPLAELKNQPLLVMFLAICYNAVGARRLRGLQLFRVAVSAANSRRGSLPDIERLLIWTAESAALRLIGFREHAGGVALRALTLLAELPAIDQEEYLENLPPMYGQLGISLYHAGRRSEAITAFEFGAALAETRLLDNGLTNLAMLSGIAALDGDVPRAREIVEQIRARRWRPEWVDGYQGTYYRIAEAILALEQGDMDRAWRAIEVFEPHRRTSEHWIAMATVEALVRLGDGSPAAAMERIEAYAGSRSREAHRASDRRQLSATRALLRLAAGDIQGAKRVLQRDASDDDIRTWLSRARIALAEDRANDCLRMLNRRRTAEGTPRERADASALRTAALLRAGNRVLGAEEALSLTAILSEYDLQLPLALLSPEDLLAVKGAVASSGAGSPSTVASVMPATARAQALSPRERVVLEALMTGLPLPAVARRLEVSPNTIKTQVRSLYRKLGVAGREEAIAAAMSMGLLDSAEE